MTAGDCGDEGKQRAARRNETLVAMRPVMRRLGKRAQPSSAVRRRVLALHTKGMERVRVRRRRS